MSVTDQENAARLMYVDDLFYYYYFISLFFFKRIFHTTYDFAKHESNCAGELLQQKKKILVQEL